MDPTLLTALGTLFATTGTGVGFFIKRADARRQANEAALIAHLKAELDKERAKSALLAAAVEVRTTDGAAWREQLIANDITPKPEHWTPLPKEDR